MQTRGRLEGKVATYFKNGNKKGRLVFVISHDYWVDGGLSNWVTFRYVNHDRTLGKKGGDYDFTKNFKNARRARLKIFNTRTK